MSSTWLDVLLSPAIGRKPCDSVTHWWPRHRALCAARPSTIEQAIVGGFESDRAAWAFATAYQAALRALVPQLPNDRLVALCVTEAEGTAPAAMRSELRASGDGLVLNGAKRWTTLGPDGALFLVAARDTRVQGERPAIRLVKVPTHAPGVRIETMPLTPFVPEVAHARLQFENVAMGEDALLPGDGYAHYVKPFRSIEDLHVHAAVLAYLVGESRSRGWAREWTERAVAVLASFVAMASLDPAAASTHVALAGALDAGEALAKEADPLWAATPDDPAASRWRRDRALLGIASQARKARRERAWERLQL